MANYDIPDYPVKRPRFFNTQFLIDQDFIDDDAFQIAHERAFLRALCVAGVCEGLSVTYPAPGKPPSISAGVAIDSKGRMIVVGAATDAAARPDALADGDYYLHISFLETEDDKATSQSAPDYTRWKQTPAINVTAKPASPPDTAVVLGSCTVQNKAFVGAGSLAGRQYSGLRLPGANKLTTATLRNTGVADDLAVLGGSLAIRRDAAGQIGPTLTLQNAQTTAGTGGAIDFARADPGTAAPAARVQSLDDGNFSSHLAFATRQPGALINGLVERLRLTSDGVLRFANDTPKDKLVAFDNGTDRYGLGLNASNINLFCPAAARFSLRQGSATGTEVFTVGGTGNGTFAGTLSVAGAATVTGALTASSTLTATGAATLNSTLTVGGTLTASGALAVTGAATLNSTLTVGGTLTASGALSAGGALAVTGTSTLGSGALVGSIGIGGGNFYGAVGFPYETIQMNPGHNLRIWFGTTERFLFLNSGIFQSSALRGIPAAWKNVGADGTVMVDNLDYHALMIVGSNQNQGHGRWVRMWDDVQVEGSLNVIGGISANGGISTNGGVGASGTISTAAGFIANGGLILGGGAMIGGDTTVRSDLTVNRNLSVDGSITYSGSLRQSSSIHTKTSIHEMPDALTTLEQLRPVTYERGGASHAGFLAEEVREVFSHGAAGDTDEFFAAGIRPDCLLALTIAAVQELSDRVRALSGADGARSAETPASTGAATTARPPVKQIEILREGSKDARHYVTARFRATLADGHARQVVRTLRLADPAARDRALAAEYAAWQDRLAGQRSTD